MRVFLQENANDIRKLHVVWRIIFVFFLLIEIVYSELSDIYCSLVRHLYTDILYSMASFACDTSNLNVPYMYGKVICRKLLFLKVQRSSSPGKTDRLRWPDDIINHFYDGYNNNIIIIIILYRDSKTRVEKCGSADRS